MKKSTFRHFLPGLAVLLFIITTACAPGKKMSFLIMQRTPQPTRNVTTLMAGTAETGITPPPGIPMAGYSVVADKGQGVRNKLMARVIYIKPPTGKPVALVQTDLLGGSRVVHHRIAELVAPYTDLETGGLLIAGTHTHSGPGHYFGTGLYDRVASNKSGFSKKYFDFLCSQISKAIITAYNTRRPARLATGRTEIVNVSTNRSLPAYLKNENIKKLPQKPTALEAVNPSFYMLRIDGLDDDQTYKPMAIFSIFSMHSNTNTVPILDSLYSADIPGFVSRLVKDAVKNQYQPSWDPVYAIFNHTHGDSNPKYSQEYDEDFTDQERLGKIIAAKAWELFTSLDGQLEAGIPIQYQAKEIDVFKENTIDGIKIAQNPKMGWAKVGGAAGRGRSTIGAYLPFTGPGWPRWFSKSGDHAEKRILLGVFQGLVLPKKIFPHSLFLQAIRIGDTVILPLPWEISYEMGVRIMKHAAEQAEAAGMTGVERFLVTGCSNDYWEYLTTREEYSLQHYEGASNLYGPNTGEFVKAQVGHMVEALAKEGTASNLPPYWKVTIKARDFYPKILPPKANRSIDRRPIYHKALPPLKKEPYWSFRWVDVHPGLIEFHKPLVAVETSTDGENWSPLEINGTAVDDTGSYISIHSLKTKNFTKNMGLYEVRWNSPLLEAGKHYRFAVEPRMNQEKFYSPPFHKTE